MERQIDDRARPMMIPLIQGQQVRLSQTQLRIIATWAAMKAMVTEMNHGAKSGFRKHR
jgi:hypothetical protein